MPSVSIGTSILGPNGETFAISDYLGHGAFGEVYRAVGATSGTVVAAKLLPLGELSSDSSRAALLNEVKAAQQIKHPNVVEVFYVSDGTASPVGPYVVMEYVSGGTLQKQIRAAAQANATIPLDRAIEMMMDVAQGARAINEKIVHRDIKPDNILLEGTTLKIGDFGISKFLDEATRDYTFKGGQHPRYMGPEGWINSANTVKLDVYSVGLVYYEILTLRNPLFALVKDPNNVLDWQRAHLYEHVPDARSIRSDVPISVSQLLSRMVAKRPEDRPDWTEVLRVLSQPGIAATNNRPMVSAAVQASVQRKDEDERKRLAAQQETDKREQQVKLYSYSCLKLLDEMTPIVEQFNVECQHAKLMVSKGAGTTRYVVPGGQVIEVSFFQPPTSPINVRTASVVGGGWIGLSKGRSANLVLMKRSADDLYGQWETCQCKFSGIVGVAMLRKLSHLSPTGVEPFGLKNGAFYEHIQHLGGAMHVLLYDLSYTVQQFFETLLLEACKWQIK